MPIGGIFVVEIPFRPPLVVGPVPPPAMVHLPVCMSIRSAAAHGVVVVGVGCVVGLHVNAHDKGRGDLEGFKAGDDVLHVGRSATS